MCVGKHEVVLYSIFFHFILFDYFFAVNTEDKGPKISAPKSTNDSNSAKSTTTSALPVTTTTVTAQQNNTSTDKKTETEGIIKNVPKSHMKTTTQSIAPILEKNNEPVKPTTSDSLRTKR